MEKEEMVKTLMEKTGVSSEEAKEALESCNWDILDAVIYLEKKKKAVAAEILNDDNKEEQKKEESRSGGFGAVIGRIFRFIGKLIKKGNENFFEIRKENEKPMKISLTISILLAVFLPVPVVIILIIGLFCGYKYSLSGRDCRYNSVNNVFDNISKSADNIKKDFKEGYEG